MKSNFNKKSDSSDLLESVENGTSNHTKDSKESKSLLSKKKNWPSPTIALLVCIWYFSAVISITTSKKVLNIVKVPYILCAVQVSPLSYLKIS